ncbi:MAG: hybrid sensor histidine kinase/response regulator [Candidatus Riflebacteria bacterium]|nr:hybrid sensor histidine kinase/response regulator [Candidatus Riflebacteria bacterium]
MNTPNTPNEKRRPVVLIVDDEARNLRLLDALVTPLDVEVISATSGQQALELTESLAPDVILLDIMMPGLDGIEVCRRLKSRHELRTIPVVFVTALTDAATQAAAIEAGAIGFITKPVQDVLVEASVKNALRMKELSDEVERLHQHREALSGMIAHDIRNLVQIVLGYAEMAQRVFELPKALKNMLAPIPPAAREILMMTTCLLDLSKLESGTLSLTTEPLDVLECARDRVAMISSRAHEQALGLEVADPGNRLVARADRSLLTRVIDNLLSNAVKFTPPGGTVLVDGALSTRHVVLGVTNDGPPIPSEYHRRIFEKFAQLEVRKATGLKGVGLGLAFCKVAVEAMSGTVEVESPVAGRSDGARFTVRLPVDECRG